MQFRGHEGGLGVYIIHRTRHGIKPVIGKLVHSQVSYYSTGGRFGWHDDAIGAYRKPDGVVSSLIQSQRLLA
jgi:hypothetical protein